MAKSLQERTAELQNRKFSGAPASGNSTPELKTVTEKSTESLVQITKDKAGIPRIIPKKDTTVRLPFSTQRAELGGSVPYLGAASRFAVQAGIGFIESTVVGSLRAASQVKEAVTGEKLNVPGLSISADLSLGGDYISKVTSEIPTFSDAALKRQGDLDTKRPKTPYLNTLQAASEEIFLPLLDAIPVLGSTLRTGVKTLRAASLSDDAVNAFKTVGYKVSADKNITEEAVKSSVKKTALNNIKDLETGKITPEQYLERQTQIGQAVDTLNEGQTRFGRVGASLNDLANSLTQERSLVKKSVTITPEGIPVVRSVNEPIEVTESLLAQQNRALRGELEASRLSNADVLANTIKQNSLEGNIGPESNINVFTIGNRQLKPGTRVSLDRELARGIVGNSPRDVGVKVSDLIQLEDGTFVYAPKALVDTGNNAISTLRKSVREEVLAREKTARKTAQKQKQAREAFEESQRKVRAFEDARAATEEALKDVRESIRRESAEKTLKEAQVTVAKRKADVDVEVAKDIAKIQAESNVAKASLKSAIDNVKIAGKTVKTLEKKILTIQKAIAKAKKQGRATARLNQTLTKAKADLVDAKKAQRSAQTAAKKAKDSVPTNTGVKVAELKAKADVKKAQIVEESKKAIAEARAVIKELSDSTKMPSARQAERLQAKIDKLEGKKAKLIEAYGGIDEVPASKIKEIDDAIEALGEVSTAEVKSTKASASQTKTASEAEPVKIKPVKIEGTDVETSTLAKRLGANLKNMEDVPEFNVATHAKQTENALDHIAKYGINDTLKMIEKGSFPDGTTKASMVSSLMEAIDAVTDPALKLNYTNRLSAYIPELSEFATRAGQEIEALKILHKDNPVMKIMRIQRILNSKDNIKRTAAEVAKLEKQLSKVDTKSIIKEAIDKSTC
jgi:hypothetical protein